mgnify:CR=1 FL=1
MSRNLRTHEDTPLSLGAEDGFTYIRSIPQQNTVHCEVSPVNNTHHKYSVTSTGSDQVHRSGTLYY